MHLRAGFHVFRRCNWQAVLHIASILGILLLTGCGGLGFARPEPVEIRFTYIDGTADYASLVQVFQKEHPQITVVLEPIPADNMAFEALHDRAAEVDAVRIAAMNTGDALLQKFLPLDSMFSTEEQITPEDFFWGSLEGLELDGKLMGLPAGLSPYVVFYLPEKLAAAGVPVPSPTWTLEDFVTTAAAVHNVDEALVDTDRFAYGYCSHYTLPDLMVFTFMFGGGIFDTLYASPAPTLNRPENVEAVAWYASLANDLQLMPEGGPGAWASRYLYGGKCAFWFDLLGGGFFGGEPVETARMLPLPRYVSPFNIATEEGYFILASSEHPEEAYQWIRFLLEQPSASGYQVPPIRSIIQSEAYAGLASPEMLAVARSLPEQTVILGLELYRNESLMKAMEYFGGAAGSVIDEGADPQMALDEAQRLAEQSLP